MVETGNTKFVNFEKYCQMCKYSDTSPTADPCNDCLAVGAREGTEEPVEFKENE